MAPLSCMVNVELIRKENVNLVWATPHVNMSTLTLVIRLEKVVGGSVFLALGYTSIRVKYCHPTRDLGKVLTTINWSGPLQQ